MKSSILCLALFALLVRANAQSLWNDQTSRSMVADKRACAIGDIVTIVVRVPRRSSRTAH